MRAFEKAPPEAQALLPKRIRELGLRLEGSAVEPFVHQLYDELEQKGLHQFRPACYLTDEWGCPSGEPVIGIPFYLADPSLAHLEHAVNDLETDRETMMYLRHEAGHAFNYAYELYKTVEWRELFGPFRRAYRDDYRPVPFSKRFVRHIAGWYAQKHPDEDFAETFAVWLTPRSNWRKRYAGWPAIAKLQYVDRVAHEVADKPPLREIGETDITVEEMESTVEEFYRENSLSDEEIVAGLALDTDLEDIFVTSDAAREDSVRASAVVARHRKSIVDKVSYWSGLRRPLAKRLVEAVEDKLTELDLFADPGCEADYLIEITSYVTTLAHNYVMRGKFVES